MVVGNSCPKKCTGGARERRLQPVTVCSAFYLDANMDCVGQRPWLGSDRVWFVKKSKDCCRKYNLWTEV